MTVVVKKSKPATHSKDVTKSRDKTTVGVKEEEINEFNLQSNKERKKVLYSWDMDTIHVVVQEFGL